MSNVCMGGGYSPPNHEKKSEFDKSKSSQGASLVVQWIRLPLLVQGAQVRPLVGKLRSHMLHSQEN